MYMKVGDRVICNRDYVNPYCGFKANIGDICRITKTYYDSEFCEIKYEVTNIFNNRVYYNHIRFNIFFIDITDLRKDKLKKIYENR